MKTNARLASLLHLFSPQTWLVVALVSALLAVGSGAILISRGNAGETSRLVRTYDTVELFILDTIRLSFKKRKLSDVQDAVFVAPKGILDESTTFFWIDDAKDVEQKTEPALPEPVAPVRLLDPEWHPHFSGLKSDKDSR